MYKCVPLFQQLSVHLHYQDEDRPDRSCFSCITLPCHHISQSEVYNGAQWFWFCVARYGRKKFYASENPRGVRNVAYNNSAAAFYFYDWEGEMICGPLNKFFGFIDIGDSDRETYLLDIRNIDQCAGWPVTYVRTLISGKCTTKPEMCANLEKIRSYCKQYGDNPSCTGSPAVGSPEWIEYIR
ncbi:hypothetical protein QR680_008149 [Steinernema hermaphroditum]|uniref:Uncharacterized protein n=1 Tax=Steinernema hermaphroditum TaxID=289476 RepID=A0AA39IFL8_9BILA|nr:hypothetical protein QR680_008149 [Steinernema hermaphroditum]